MIPAPQAHDMNKTSHFFLFFFFFFGPFPYRVGCQTIWYRLRRPDSTGRIQAAKSQGYTENELAFVYKEVSRRVSVPVVKKIKLNKQISGCSFCCWKYIWGNSRRCVLAGKKDNYHAFERNFFFIFHFF